LKFFSFLTAVLAAVVLGCPTDTAPAPEPERDLPAQGLMSKETADLIFEWGSDGGSGVEITLFKNSGNKLSEYLAGNTRLAAAVSDQPFKINRIDGKPVTRIGGRAFSPAAGAAAVGAVVLRIELPVTIVELGASLFEGVEVKITVEIPASAVEKLKENYIKKHNLDAQAAANLELGEVLGEISAGSSVDIRQVEDPAAPGDSTGGDPTAAAQFAADLNAVSAGSAVVNGAAVTLSGKLLIERPFTVPAGVTLDVTADGAALALRNAALTVNGTVISGPERVRLEDNAGEGTLNGNGTIQLKGKGQLLVVRGNRKLTLDGVTLTGVADNDGPLVQVDDGGALVMKSGKITGNTHIDNEGIGGGGVRVGDGGAFTMQGGAISGNAAQGGDGWSSGGGVRVEDGGAFTMEGGAISGNTAQGRDWSDGGGVGVGKGIFTMKDGAISGNTAKGSGGVHVDSSSTFIMEEGAISGNTSQVGGGGGVHIRKDSTFTMQGGAISGNTGGGVGISEDSTFTMAGGTISENSAQGGGGVHIRKDSTFTMQGGAISGNTAQGGGGGVGISEDSTFTMAGGTISENSAQGGDGVEISGDSTFTMAGGAISGNTAESDGWAEGGGVRLYKGTFIMKDGAISGNTAKSDAYDSGSGGVAVRDGSTFTMTGGTISGNTAESNNGSLGGGVGVWADGAFTMTGGAISGNTAGAGGGVIVWADGAFTMTGGTISGNTAESNNGSLGGGVTVWDGTFTMQGGTIYGKSGSAGTAASLANNASTDAALSAAEGAAKWGMGGTYTKGGEPQTGGSDIGSTDETLIAAPAK
jgi:hypothetical protein